MKHQLQDLIVLCLGGFLVILGLVNLFKSWKLKRVYTQVSGTVVDHVFGAFPDGDPSEITPQSAVYHIISFETKEHKSYSFTSIPSHSKLAMGSKVKVLYNPKNPEQAMTKSGREVSLQIAVVSIIGGVLLLSSIIERLL